MVLTLFLSVKYHADQRNRAHIEALLAALEGAGQRCACVVRDLEAWGEIAFRPDDLMRRTFALIDDCDALLIDLKEKGVGVGLEAGHAHARGRPVIVLLPDGAELSTTLAGIARAVVPYAAYADLRAALAARLPELGLSPPSGADPSGRTPSTPLQGAARERGRSG